MIQDSDITAWLGDAQTEMTDDQIARFAQLVRDHHAQVITARPGYGTSDYYDDDYADDDTAAWIAALEIVTGTFDLAARGRAKIAAKTDATAGAVMAVLAGQGEVTSSEAAAMSRMTLRKALGK